GNGTAHVRGSADGRGVPDPGLSLHPRGRLRQLARNASRHHADRGRRHGGVQHLDPDHRADRGLRARHRGHPPLPAGPHGGGAGEMSTQRAGIALTLTVWLLLGACPLLVGEWRLSQLAQITSYGIFAMSLAFLWGQTGLLCFGHAIFFGTGAYVMGLITKGMLPGVGDATVTGLLAAALLSALV